MKENMKRKINIIIHIICSLIMIYLLIDLSSANGETSSKQSNFATNILNTFLGVFKSNEIEDIKVNSINLNADKNIIEDQDILNFTFNMDPSNALNKNYQIVYDSSYFKIIKQEEDNFSLQAIRYGESNVSIVSNNISSNVVPIKIEPVLLDDYIFNSKNQDYIEVNAFSSITKEEIILLDNYTSEDFIFTCNQENIDFIDSKIIIKKPGDYLLNVESSLSHIKKQIILKATDNPNHKKAEKIGDVSFEKLSYLPVSYAFNLKVDFLNNDNEISDEQDFYLEGMSKNILIDQNKIIGLEEGIGKVKIFSLTNPSVFKIFQFEIKLITLENFELIFEEKDLAIGDIVKLKINYNQQYVNKEDLHFTYESLNPDIISIDEQGFMTGLKKGKGIIKVTSNNNITKEIEVSVKPLFFLHDQIDDVNHYIRKILGHFLFFSVMSYFITMSIYLILADNKILKNYSFIFSLVIGSYLAFLAESLQNLTVGRGPSISDSFIDIGGYSLTIVILILIRIIIYYKNKRKNKKSY